MYVCTLKFPNTGGHAIVWSGIDTLRNEKCCSCNYRALPGSDCLNFPQGINRVLTNEQREKKGGKNQTGKTVRGIFLTSSFFCLSVYVCLGDSLCLCLRLSENIQVYVKTPLRFSVISAYGTHCFVLLDLLSTELSPERYCLGPRP